MVVITIEVLLLHSARIMILITRNCRHTKIMHTTITKGERD